MCVCEFEFECVTLIYILEEEWVVGGRESLVGRCILFTVGELLYLIDNDLYDPYRQRLLDRYRLELNTDKKLT